MRGSRRILQTTLLAPLALCSCGGDDAPSDDVEADGGAVCGSLSPTGDEVGYGAPALLVPVPIDTPVQWAATDVDQDGDLDIVLAGGDLDEPADPTQGIPSWSRFGLFVARGTADGLGPFEEALNLTELIDYLAPYYSFQELADLDFDGDLDFTFFIYGDPYFVENDQGSFLEPLYTAFMNTGNRFVADLDRNGLADSVSWRTDSIHVYYDFADGAYSSRSFAEFGQLSRGRLHAADFNGDGRPDLNVGTQISLAQDEYYPDVVDTLEVVTDAVGHVDDDDVIDFCGLAGSTLQCQLGPGIPGNREVLEWDAGLGAGDDDHYNLRAEFVDLTNDDDLDLLAFDHVGQSFSVFKNLNPDDRAPGAVFAMGPGQPFLADLNCDGVVDVLTIGPEGFYETLSQP